MDNSWTDVVGTPVIAALAKECSVQLTPDLIRFLDLYSEQLHVAGRTRAINRRTAAKKRQELREVIEVVQEEVKNFRDSHQEHEPKIEHLTVARQRETYIPVVHCTLRSLPTMVLHVRRTYATQRIIAGISWKLSEWRGGTLAGRVRNAMNYVRTYSRGRKHQLTIYDILRVWFASGLGIPTEEREVAADGGEIHPIRYQNVRERKSNPKTAVTRPESDSDSSSNSYQTSSIAQPMNRAKKRALPNYFDDDENVPIQPRKKPMTQAGATFSKS